MYPTSSARSPRTSLRTWLVLVLFAAIPLGPLAVGWLRSERELWRAAAAIRDLRAGGGMDALERLRAARDADPRNAGLQLALVIALWDQRQLEQAADEAERLQEIVASASGSAPPDFARLEEATRWHARCLFASGRKTAAVQELLRLSEAARGTDWEDDLSLVNGVAYYRALLGRQPGLRQGIEAIRSQLERIQTAGRFGQIPYVGVQNRGRLALGLLATRTDNRAVALPLLDEEIRRLQEKIGQLEPMIPAAWYEWLTLADPAQPPGESPELLQIRSEYGIQQIELAALLTVRSLLQEDPAATEADREQVRELGQDPDQLLGQFPDLRGAIREAESSSALLDTAGYLLFRNGEYDEAEELVHLACEIQSVVGETIAGVAGEDPADPRDPEWLVRERNQTLAVLWLHRSEIRKALRKGNEAAEDLQRIRAAGFDPDDPRLF